MKFVSWNVNGLRAIAGKGFADIFKAFDADCFCLQETKLQAGQIDLDFEGYRSHFNYAERKGYSGTAIYSRLPELSVTNGIGCPEHDTEGRVITIDLGGCYLVDVYTPNSQNELARLDYRMQWETAFADYLHRLDMVKPVVVCGDLNVAHCEIDLANPSRNRRNAGFTDEERSAMSSLLACGFIDTFRHMHPDLAGAYSWWSYRGNARAKNVGWRIDYFLVSERLAPKIVKAAIHDDVVGSDHCPVSLELDI
ncbi:MAG: exodeoxyribonuclease III [Bacteroidales bacterium]|nr:exodeoxyribonuclease III [Bacteroidales bacterium]